MERIRPISMMIAIFSLALVISYHIYYHFIDNVNISKVDNYIIKEETKELSTNKVEKINIKEKDAILGVLEIPKINLKKAFYDIESSENDVNKNIEILKGSKMPDIAQSALFIAAHSGDSYLSYFKNLDLLQLNDNVIIHYQNSKYYYSISDIYEINKDGKINVNKNIHENILVLTTCSKNKGKQLVVIAKMITT